MADTTQLVATAQGERPTPPSGPKPLTRQQLMNRLYALPAPLRTFPLPSFVPHNPLSFFHILYVWVSQTVKPEPSHYQPLYHGWFSADTRSVHITDIRSVRGLWEHGFYGKGTLSRSEPSWLNREKNRRGTKLKVTSEEITRKRRLERQQKKWERARTEREAIDQRRSEEVEAEVEAEVEQEVRNAERETLHIADVTPKTMGQNVVPPSENDPPLLQRPNRISPVGPLELLSFPNSPVELKSLSNGIVDIVSCTVDDLDTKFVSQLSVPPVGPKELLALPNSLKDFAGLPLGSNGVNEESLVPPNGRASISSAPRPHTDSNGNDAPIELRLKIVPKVDEIEVVGGSDTNEDAIDGSTTHSEDTIETSTTGRTGFALVNENTVTPKIKRQKSVRFSPTVEKNTFVQTEPPSPERSTLGATMVEEEPHAIKDQEHMQLTLEEAFFVSYALGALEILDPETKRPISNQDLFALFRKASYFLPIANPSLSPDDPFMVNYVVYHHFRSLGWVPRSGVKFSVDLMLYNRGPVFTHAEFGVLILPSYSDPYWRSDVFLQNYVAGKEKRSWAWVSCINRVITQVKKTLIIVYVDIPKPLDHGEEEKLGIDGVLGRYGVREVVMKRWVANRMRD